MSKSKLHEYEVFPRTTLQGNELISFVLFPPCVNVLAGSSNKTGAVLVLCDTSALVLMFSYVILKTNSLVFGVMITFICYLPNI